MVDTRSKEAAAYRWMYSDVRWLRRREEHLASNPYCVMCLEEGKTKLGTIVDHTIPHKGDEELFFKGELQTLCSSHHNSVKQSQERTGHRKGFDHLGRSLDKNNAWNSDTYVPATGPPMGGGGGQKS